ncbi:hypothetical protein BKP35_07750 [Anaerobacillus arseniciselenatis]|uniref:Uncharacterized protein n=1 Tax=Anaerobacillus arseniciselenatis TaxID=85682 RepID=A0A1S2LNZ2_9BACI|nr:hypothetical protein [Anaerobacillus arseniciselenatis]OIJ14086.1 hypothetical protein BKP35_07750 [Anaerobacillus arseniciselenatis]
MTLNKYNFDEMDMEFILDVQFELEKHFGKDASTILVQSDFLKRLADDPMYVHHYDETYWADRIRALHEKKSSSTVN